MARPVGVRPTIRSGEYGTAAQAEEVTPIGKRLWNKSARNLENAATVIDINMAHAVLWTWQVNRERISAPVAYHFPGVL